MYTTRQVSYCCQYKGSGVVILNGSHTVTERLVDAVLRKSVVSGCVAIVYPSGVQRVYGDGNPQVTLRIKKLPLLALRSPDMFVGESYMRGDIEIPEQQLPAFFQILSINQGNSAFLDMLQVLHRRQRNSYKYQKSQISHHYDLGNDYYKLWLDRTLTYSCAYFQTAGDSLYLAQQQKTDYVLRKLRLEAGQTMLDIGSGWGYLCVAAAERYGVRALGITLSNEQLKGAYELARKRGVAGRVEFKLLNYQDLDDSVKFDRIISVGMYEHVGKNNHATYFDKLSKILAPDGVSVLHTITHHMDRPTSVWVDKYIFPGGYLPTISSIESLMVKHGFWPVDREDLWQHYARTLDLWRKRHQKNRNKIIKMYDEMFYRCQDFWLAGSSASFSHGGNGLSQFVFTHSKPPMGTWPLTRAYLYG